MWPVPYVWRQNESKGVVMPEGVFMYSLHWELLIFPERARALLARLPLKSKVNGSLI